MNINKWKLIPKLAWTGVIKNGSVYFPYIGAGIFSVFTYFVFSSILHNDLMNTLPRSGYVKMLLVIGRGLLALILIPFLYYANGFLIKRRKKEIGLYHILGLEKKHIGSMMLFETMIIYLVIMLGGLISGILLSKLLFILLLKMTGLPVDAQFVFYPKAAAETAIIFFWICMINLISNIMAVGKSKAAELLSGSKKGEKEPKLLWIYALLGMVILGCGYAIAIRSKLDSMIFTNFFLAVLLVVAGTYLLFTSGSVACLKILKNNKRFYYQPSNFITISGMYYRMKKNAASLVNICIFSTMVIITLVCTASLNIGLDGISDFMYPYDVAGSYGKEWEGEEKFREKTSELEAKYGVKAIKNDIFSELSLSCGKSGNVLHEPFERFHPDNYTVYFISLEDYNRMENCLEELEENEALILSTGEDFEYGFISIAGKELKIKKELKEIYAFPKEEKNTFLTDYYLIVKDKTVMEECVKAWAAVSGVEDIKGYMDSYDVKVKLKLDGEEESKTGFVNEFIEWISAQPGFQKESNGLEGRAMSVSMNGGLLFIGILFSLIFIMCLVLIMYYKQIAEGYEDKESFNIMQKVGMSDKEIKSTIHRQILLVFFLPLAGSILHTTAGMFMVSNLFGAINMYNTTVIIFCSIMVVIIFAFFYGGSYLYTARTYYRIVRQREA